MYHFVFNKLHVICIGIALRGCVPGVCTSGVEYTQYICTRVRMSMSRVCECNTYVCARVSLMCARVYKFCVYTSGKH